jgi:GNAT superfamily N-acetyltransferase
MVNKNENKGVSNLIIEDARKRDLKFIVHGIKDICKIEKERSEKEIILIKKTRKAIKNKQIKVARINNITVGFLQYAFSRNEPYGLNYGKREKFCWIEWTYVAKKYRRKGIGHLLHKEVISVCKNNNIQEIMLDVFEINKKARNFYSKENFNNFIHILREKI